MRRPTWSREGFGPGFNGRLTLVVSSASAEQTAAAVEQVGPALQGTTNLVTITPPTMSGDQRTALLGIIPTDGPTAASTETLVHDVRARTHGLGGADVAVTGQTAVGVDVSEKLADALPVYLLIVVGLSVLLLMLVFRSILVPVKAALGFLLTVGATFGITVWIFQEGHLAGLLGIGTPGPLISFLPILLVGILFGLAMDYEVFLVSRMREDHVHGADAQQATISGMGHGARVVTAAALIMISVFAGFVLIDDPIIKSIGFALALGVAVDAFVVRMTIVPAVMSLLGRGAWWLPRWLDRALPNVDIEGEKLRKELVEPPDRVPVGVGRLTDRTAAPPTNRGLRPRRPAGRPGGVRGCSACRRMASSCPVTDDLGKDYLHGQPGSLVWRLDGPSEYDVRRPLTATGTNLLGLVKHVATVEAGHFGEVSGRPFPEPLRLAEARP